MIENIIDNRYRILEEIFHGKIFSVYDASDLNEEKRVTLNLLHDDVKQNPLERLLRFRRDVQSISKVSHPNLLTIIAFGQMEHREYFITEDIRESQLLSHFARQPLQIDQAADIVLQVCKGLAVAHDLGIIHRAISPSNILIFRDQDRVTAKLAGFGLGLLIDLVHIEDEQDLVNTLGYMAPEGTGMLRKPIDERSDLYSLGIIFYQLVTGTLPYEGRDTSTLIHQHIAQEPAPPTEVNRSVPPVIERMILRLIAKAPVERYQTVFGLLADLEQYRSQRTEGVERPDFEIARRDRSTAPHFATRLVGRDKELTTLHNLIKRTMQRKGSLAIVYGAPGVGKSRLVDEIRETVLKTGGMYIRGKCNQYESTMPFGVFAEVLDAYVRKVNRTSVEQHNAVVERMKKAVGELGEKVVRLSPTFADLIGEHAALEELVPEKERYRFMITISNVFANIGTDDNPLILFLDDLQWADDGSIELIERIAEGISTHPMMVVAGYRDSELYAGHPWLGALERMREKNIPLTYLPVEPFGIEDTEELVAEILLEDREDILPLTNVLHERTKGNAFFVIELLRSFVDEHIVHFKDNHYRFDIKKLGAASLPTNIVDVVMRRIHDISDEGRKVLSYGAIIGREIDFERLSLVTGLARDRVLNAIEEGVRSQVLSRSFIDRESIRFSHDKIREAFYNRVTEEERIDLHKKYAAFLEKTYRDNIDPVIFELAHHFEQGKIEDKTLVYCIKAGKKAQDSYAPDEAIRFYEVGLTILRRKEKTTSVEYIDTLENLGASYYQAGRYDQALKTLGECESLIPKGETLRKAGVLSKTGDALQKKGELKRCEEVLIQALELLGIGFPGNIVTVGLGILRQLSVHALHSVLPIIFVKKEYTPDPKIQVVVHLFYRLFYLYYFTDLIKSIYVLFRAQNMVENKLGPSRHLSQIVAISAMGWMQIGWAWWARRNARLAEETAETLNDRACIGLASAFHAWVEHPYRAPESVRLANRAVNLLKSVGEYWDLGHAGCCLLWGYQKTGREFNKLIEENKRQVEIMQSIDALQNLGWTLGVRGQLLAYIGDERLKTEGIQTLEESIRLLEEVNDKPWVLCATGYLAYAHLRAGNYDQAVQMADRVAKRFFTDHNLTTWLLDIVGMCAQVYLHNVVNNSNLTNAEKRRYLKKAKYFCVLARFKGWMYPNYRGWGYLVNGTYQWLKGRKNKAIRTWERGITYVRESTQDRFRLANLLTEEASFLLEDDPDNKKAQEYLIEAKELFEQVGGTWDKKRVEKLLGTAFPDKELVGVREGLTLTRHLESLLSVTQAISSIFNLEELLDEIVDQAMRVTGAERGFLLLYDEREGRPRLKVSRGIDEQVGQNAFSYERYGISLEMIQKVERGKRALVVGENTPDLPAITAELRECRVKEALCVPLRAKEKHLGFIYLDNRLAGGIFGQEELELMISLAVQASVSIENARLVRELVEQERLMQEVMEQAADAIILHDPEGKIINANQQACENLRYSRDELLNMNITDIEIARDPTGPPSIPEGLESGGVTFFGVQKRKDGSTFPVEARVSLVEYRGRRLVLSLARDITERRRAEEAMVQAKEDWENTFDAIADMVMLLDDGHHILRVNKAAAEALGTTKESLVGKKCYEAIHGTDRSIGRCPLTKTMNSLKAYTVEITEPRLGGTFLCSTSPILNHEGKLTGYTHTLKDITASKRLEAQLRQAQKMEAIASLAGGVAHDLNNILAGIVSYPDLLLTQLPKDSPLRQPILTIRESGEKAADIVEDLLTMARRGIATPEISNLNDIVSEYLKSPEHEKLVLRYPALEVETRLGTDLSRISASRVHLSKTIMNLISNAAEAMPHGGRVVVSTENRYVDTPVRGYSNVMEGDYVALTVSDNGVGIAPEDLGRIYEPFWTKKKMGRRSGSGLGMTVVWGTMEDHRGYIDVQSTVGKGTTFTLYFPATRKEPLTGWANLTIEDYKGQGESVLVIDDAKEQREIACTILAELGYSAASVASGEEAIDYMKDNRVDILLLDMIMESGMDGLETYKRIVELHPGQKAIIASGFSETDRVREAQKLGAGPYVKKPYTLEKIGMVVRSELEK